MSKAVNVWRLMTHHDNPTDALKWMKENNRVAIGWGLIGDIREKYADPDAIGAAIREHHTEFSNSGNGSASLWRFYADVELEDFIILSATRPRELVVVVKGAYEWQPEGTILPGHYFHQRVVRTSPLDAETLWRRAGGAKKGQGVRQTFIRCNHQIDLATLEPVSTG